MTALVLAAVLVAVGVWGHLPVWQIAAYVGLFALYAVVDLVLLRWVRSRPDGGGSLPVSIGGGLMDKPLICDSRNSSLGPSSLGRPVKRYFRAGFGSFVAATYGFMLLVCLPGLWLGHSATDVLGIAVVLVLCVFCGYLSLRIFVLSVRERGIVIRTGLFRRRSLQWTSVVAVTLVERRSDAALRGQTLALQLVNGEVIQVGAFWQSETSASRPTSYLRLITEELNAFRRGAATPVSAVVAT